MIRTIVISGASTGIGKATALALAERGHNVLAGIRNEEAAENLRSLSGGKIEPVHLDIVNAESLDRFCEQYSTRFESEGLYGLINNAGAAHIGALEYSSMEQWRRYFDINVFGHVDLTRRLLPYIRKVPGRIVFTGSISGRNPFPFGSTYSGTKAAIDAISESLRRELYPFGVKVSLVEPGAIKTPMVDDSEALFSAASNELVGEASETYRYGLAGVRKSLNDLIRNASKPQKVADAFCHALFAKSPKPKYLVGSDAKLQATLVWLTSANRMDAISRLMTKPEKDAF